MYVYYTFGCYSIAFSEAADAAWSWWRRPPPWRFPQRPAATPQQRQQQPDEHGQQQPADGQHPPVRDPHEAAQTQKLSPGLAQQVPLARQKDRRPVPRYFPRHFRVLQHFLLDLLPDAGGQY